MATSFSKCLCLPLSLSMFFGSLPISAQSGSQISCQYLFVAENADSSLPWGLKFINGVDSQKTQIPPTTIGIEVEGSFLDRYSYRDFANHLAELLASNPDFRQINIRRKVIAKSESYVVAYRYRDFWYEFGFKDDVSIYPRPHHASIEITSPILRFPEDFQFFNGALESFANKFGLKSEPSSAGVHIHVGFPDAKAREVAGLSQLFAAIETEVTEHFQMKASRSHYVMPTDTFVLDYLEKIDARAVSLVGLLDNQIRRYHTLNLKSLERFGTVEFRLFNSTVDTGHINYYINFSRGLVEAVRQKDPRLIQYLRDHLNAGDLKLVDLAKALDLDIGSPEIFQAQLGSTRSLFGFTQSERAQSSNGGARAALRFFRDTAEAIIIGAALGTLVSQAVSNLINPLNENEEPERTGP